MSKLNMLYEGKAKKVYKTEKENEYIVEYKDDATALNGLKKGTISDKGIVNNKLSAIIFKILEEKGIETHLIELLNDRETLVKAVEILPLEVIVRNIAAGSISKRLGIEEGTVLKKPLLELCYKNDELGDPFISEDHIEILNLATPKEVEIVKENALKINEVLIEFFKGINLKLVDFKIEFGRYDGRVILADEISPDTCRLWDVNTNKKMDKDRFRRDLGDAESTYQEVLKRASK
ncbi:phosphoribosylaminoimidazolesuccinocarboxamide synthase [Helicovermis profundi]|uniref:Phosphoribosylaminoimidazole-succinocarboxamide synthase n=1 Tax=Helicovermis profundi TaxID=3065157 RepID=A0AAU9ETP5_9FIRM|nr:phosphoribosylaminoimidazolesuccinocarboxamide synthase [Clostridia bacterium S502]